MTRLALLTEIPAPYRIPLFNALAERVELGVFFLRERNPERPYDLHRDELRFRWRVLPGLDVTLGHRWLVVNRSVLHAVRRADVVVLGGWNQPAFWQALAWSALRRHPTLVWVESTGADRRPSGLETLKRRLLGRVSGFIVPGRASRDYLEALGVAPDRITVAPNAVDSQIFSPGPPRQDVGRCRVLAVGRLAPEKGLDCLLEAARDLDVDVVLAGVGPEEDRLRALAGPHVSFLGQVERDALPALYASADIVVMPSRSDPWGMVLNEAALAGRPLVSTTAAGAAHELIEEGANGFLVAPDDPVALREAIRVLVEDPELRRQAGARSREIGARFTPAAWADAVAAAAERARR